MAKKYFKVLEAGSSFVFSNGIRIVSDLSFSCFETEDETQQKELAAVFEDVTEKVELQIKQAKAAEEAMAKVAADAAKATVSVTK